MELIFAIIGNIQSFCETLLILYAVAFVVSMIAKATAFEVDDQKTADYYFKKVHSKWPIATICFLLLLIPTTKQILKIRIDLVAIELSKPENIKKSTEEIARIAKELECKYLGCK